MTRQKLNVWMIGFIGLGMPAYYKIKYFLLGQIDLVEILDPSGLIDITFAASLAALILFTHDRLVDIVRPRFPAEIGPLRRFAIQLLLTTAVSMAIVTGYAHFFFGVLYPSAVTADFLFDLLILGGVFPLVVSGLKESLFYDGELESAARQRETLERENLQARYKILQSQVDPHFLFNCLNTLDELLEESKDQARKFVARLAGVYRFLLENLHHDVVALDQELQFLDAYLYLARARFGESLKVTLNIRETDRRAGLVPMTLQILFENALKHNFASSQQPLGVDISIEEGSALVFRSDRRPKRAATSFGLGLKNLSHRYRFVHGGAVDIEETDTSFTVRLPLIEPAAA